MFVRAICRACGWHKIIDDGQFPHACGNDKCGAPFFFYHRRETRPYVLTHTDVDFLKAIHVKVDHEDLPAPS